MNKENNTTKDETKSDTSKLYLVTLKCNKLLPACDEHVRYMEPTYIKTPTYVKYYVVTKNISKALKIAYDYITTKLSNTYTDVIIYKIRLVAEDKWDTKTGMRLLVEKD